MVLTQDQIEKALKKHFDDLDKVLKSMRSKIAAQASNNVKLAETIEHLIAENQNTYVLIEKGVHKVEAETAKKAKRKK